MSSEYDATEFVDSDFQAAQKRAYSSAGGPLGGDRAPKLEETESELGKKLQELADLKRRHEEVEREKAAHEETRRRQIEFQTGRQETIQNLTRGVGLLEEAEFTARRDAEQMAKALADMRDALAKVEALREEAMSRENFAVEMTRALTTIENARMEWNSARLKFPILSGTPQDSTPSAAGAKSPQSPFAGRGFFELCKLGVALTWPLVIVALLALCVFLAILLRLRR